MNFISYDDFKKLDEYKQFILENPSIGYLKVQAFTAYQGLPIEETKIIITKNINNNKVLFFRGYTNSSDIIDNIELPAPSEKHDVEKFEIPKHTEYELTAIHEGYETIKKYNISMFGNIKILQYIKMIPTIEDVETLNEN